MRTKQKLSEDFFGKVSNIYKKHGVNLQREVKSYIGGATVKAEFLSKEGKIVVKSSLEDVSKEIAHETAHAMEHIYGKVGKLNTRFYGGTSTGMGMSIKEFSEKSRKQIDSFTQEIIGREKEYIDESFRLYIEEPSEQFANFVSEMILSPSETERKYPDAVKEIKIKFKDVFDDMKRGFYLE